MPTAPPNDPITDEEDGDTEERAAKMEEVASAMSELSKFTETPDGVTLPTEPFAIDAAVFDTNAWIQRLWEIQGWLNLDAPVEPTHSTAAQLARSLLCSISSADVGSLLHERGNLVAPTAAGLDALARHLQSAISHRELFLERLEEDGRRAAQKAWSEAWEEDSSLDLSPDPVHAVAGVWPIQNFRDMALKHRLQLSPTYQRGDVWSLPDCQKLILSILRGIPLPSVIVLRKENGSFEVVDGKQRLTAILRFTGTHPECIRIVREQDEKHPGVGLERTFRTDYRKFRRLWKAHVGERLTAKVESARYFPFPLPKATPNLPQEIAELSGRYYTEIGGANLRVTGGVYSVQDIFESVVEYKLPVIEYREATPRQVHEVFHLYNRQGKHLNAEEIRNALYHEVPLARLLLAASGDGSDLGKLVPFVPNEKIHLLRETGELLTDFRFGSARYRRTKLLGWLISAALYQPTTDGIPAPRSTARQIDGLLEQWQTASGDRRSIAAGETRRLLTLLEDVHATCTAVGSFTGWSPSFCDGKTGDTWEELPLVAALLGVFMLQVGHGNPGLKLAEARGALYTYTGDKDNRRPAKTQTRDQWVYTARISLGILRIVGANVENIESELLARYGCNCVPWLRALCSTQA